MANTTFYGIPLPADGAQDWVPVLNRVLSMITESMRRNQKPSSANLLWGDISGNKYLLVDAGGVKAIGGLDTTLQPTKNFVLESGSDFPATYATNQLFVKDGVAYRRTSSAWVALGQTDGDVIVEAGGVLITDFGGVLGTFLVSDGDEGVTQVSPGADGTICVADSGSATGWTLQTPSEILATVTSAKGDLITRGAGATEVVPVGANGTMLTADSTAAGGMAWKTFASRLALSFSAKGQILAGTGASAFAAVPAPAANDYVQISDSTQATGMRWVPQSELGSLPGARTRAAADLFLHANFF